MDKAQSLPSSNTLPESANVNLTDQPLTGSPDKASGASFDILSQNPSEEYNYNYRQNQELNISTGENVAFGIKQELEVVTEEYNILQQQLEGYGNLGRMYHKTKERVNDLRQDLQHGSMDRTLHPSQLQHTEVRTPTKDIASKFMHLCDTMCTSLAQPHTVDTQLLGQGIVALARDVIGMEQQCAQQKKLIEAYRTEQEILQHEVQQLKNELHKYISQKENQIAESRQQMKYKQTTQSHISAEDNLNPNIHITHQIQNPQVYDQLSELKHLKQEYTEVKDQNKELEKANNEWEKHCQRIQEQLHKQIASLKQELSRSEEIIKSQADKQQELQLKENDDKLIKYEEQTTKAIDFANAQAQKVDELKKKFKMEQAKTEEQDSHIKQLQSISEIQKEEIDKLNTEVKRLKDTISRHESSSGSHGSLDLTLDNRNPHRNEQETVISLKTEIQVLQQQVTIYKDDFKSERHDRERAQTELSTLRNKFSQLSEDFKAQHEEVKRKNRETEALRAARDQDRSGLQKITEKEEENVRLKLTVNQLVEEQSRLQAQLERMQREADYQQPPPYEFVSRQPSDVTGHSVHSQDTAENTGASDWNCPACTFSNSGQKQKCDMCGNNAQSRYSTNNEDILPTYPGYASGYHGEAVIDRTEQCDDDIEWVKPAGRVTRQYGVIETDNDNNDILHKKIYLKHI